MCRRRSLAQDLVQVPIVIRRDRRPIAGSDADRGEGACQQNLTGGRQRARSERDRREAEQYGGSKLARDMLPVYDALRRALDSASEEQRAASPALIEGVDLTMRELTKVLTKHGVEPISPKIGDLFDPKHHEAMFEAPLPGTKVGQIIQVMTEGFMLHDRLLRPASVGVSSNTQG